MFNIDKDQLKQKLNLIIRDYYIYSQNQGTGPDSIDYMVTRKVVDGIENSVKPMIRVLIDALVDSLYDNNDFEKDISLR